MSEKRKKKVVITGATSGIGLATAHALRKADYAVLATGRNREVLDKLAEETGASVICADVRDVGALLPEVTAFAPDVLINNAGVGHGLDGLDALDGEVIQECVDINLSAPIRLTAAVVEGMKSRGRGHIVNIGSVAGLHALFSSLYGATKAAIHMFSQNLRVELCGTDIRVTEVCPGRTSSGFFRAAKGRRDRIDAIAVSGIRELQPEDVADAILYALQVPPHVNIANIELLPTDQAMGGFKMNRQ